MKKTATRKTADWTKTPPPKKPGKTPTNAKLNADIVKQSREAYSNGWTIAQLAEKLGVEWPTVEAFVTGRTWKNAGGPVGKKQA